MEQMNKNIGQNIKRVRQERKLSLDKTAALTGVSKTMLGQIERGESNPTVTTLWKIANGLRLSFSSLISQERPAVTVIKKKTIAALSENEGQYRVYPLIPFQPDKQFEVFAITLEPGCVHYSESHHRGVEEHIFVNEGLLVITVNEEVFEVGCEDSIIFVADVPHSYQNNGPKPVNCTVLIHYPS